MKKTMLICGLICALLLSTASILIAETIPSPVRVPWSGGEITIGYSNSGIVDRDIPYFFYPSGDDIPAYVPLVFSGVISAGYGIGYNQHLIGRIQQGSQFVVHAYSSPFDTYYDWHNVDNVVGGWYSVEWAQDSGYGGATGRMTCNADED